ncbi:MAG: hypothetical protein LBB74_05180 [Chitinispirillales bacterium]|nr:hypothetical protein [Chitinispirillales bacterium]
MKKSLLLTVAVAVMTVGCAGTVKNGGAGGPALAVDDAAIDSILRKPELTEFKGYGDVSMSGGGAKASGKIEAHRRNDGYVKALFYSPFGAAVASIAAEDFKGSVKVDKEVKEFTYGEKMAGVSFPCAENFTYGQFINALTGAMPEVFRELPAVPDSLKQRKKSPGKATAVWNSDTLSVRAQLKGKKGRPLQLESVIFRYNIDGSKFSILFANFKNGAAREITFKQGGRNYINVKYESVIIGR